jgi:hypothetical protein
MFESSGDFVDKPSFEESLRALAARRRGGENHPPPEDLVAYRAGDLTAEEDDRIQEHLTQCRECARLLLDLDEFEQLTPPPADLGPVDARAEASWQRLRSRLRDEEEPEEEPPILRHRPRPRVPLWRNPAVPWALAAGLALCVVGLGLRTANLQQTVRKMSEPEINLAVVDLYGDSERTTRGEAPPEEKLSGGSVLILNLPEGSSSFKDYEVELVPAAKHPSFEPQRGQAQDGVLTYRLPLSAPPGSYSVHLYGLGGDRRQLLDRYSFKISTGTP